MLLKSSIPDFFEMPKVLAQNFQFVKHGFRSNMNVFVEFISGVDFKSGLSKKEEEEFQCVSNQRF